MKRFPTLLAVALTIILWVGYAAVYAAPAEKTARANAPPAAKPLPRLVDVGADKCIPCKMMAPVLEELKSEYAGSLEVLFVDVWKNPEESSKYGIRMIPTQIFYDSSGKELYRHMGFMSREDILKKLGELNIPIKKVPKR